MEDGSGTHVQRLLYHDPVVQTSETCCASDMTEYEKEFLK